MTGDPRSPKRVVWAVDPFEELGETQRHSAEMIRCLQEKWKATVTPVHVLSPAELNLSAEFAGPWVTQYQPAAEKALAQRLSEIGLRGLEPPRILLQAAASTARAADALSAFAQELKADLIVAGTHGRTGMSRLLLGSFTETLLARSRVPVMATGPHMRAECELSEMLFPTEFGGTAKSTFKRVVAMAREFGSKVILYHAIPRPIEPIYQSGVYLMGSPWIPVHEYYGRELERARRHADAWARWARHQGVATEAVIDTETGNIAESIAALAASRRVGCVAMAARNGPIAAALLGSVTRQVIRVCDCPVWVMHWPSARQRRRQAREREGREAA